MAYYVRYNNIARKAADRLAIADIQDFVHPKTWNALLEMLRYKNIDIRAAIFVMEMAGISGYPVHAALRKYQLQAYREWMLLEGIETDEDGFRLTLETMH